MTRSSDEEIVDALNRNAAAIVRVEDLLVRYNELLAKASVLAEEHGRIEAERIRNRPR